MTDALTDNRSQSAEAIAFNEAQNNARRAVPRRTEGGASAPPADPDNEAPQVDAAYFCSASAAYFCSEAARLVVGPRSATHGDKLTNFANIAELWNGYFRIKCRMADERLVTPFTAHDVGCMMELLKIARRFSGTFNADDYIDAAGYAGCTGEVAARDNDERLRKTTPAHTNREETDPA